MDQLDDGFTVDEGWEDELLELANTWSQHHHKEQKLVVKKGGPGSGGARGADGRYMPGPHKGSEGTKPKREPKTPVSRIPYSPQPPHVPNSMLEYALDKYGFESPKARTIASDYKGIYGGGPSGKAAREQVIKNAEKLCNDNMNKIVDNNPVQIRVYPGVLNKIVADGRFKSQFESGKSEGMYSPGRRAEAEKNLMGAPTDLDDTLRPIYGYISGSASNESIEARVEQYGTITVILKDDVKERTTVTWGDSLEIDQNGGRAKPYLDMDKSGAYHSDQAGELMDGKVPDDYGYFYVEAQIHGGVTLDDIADIKITKGYDIPELSSDVWNFMKSHGMKI